MSDEKPSERRTGALKRWVQARTALIALALAGLAAGAATAVFAQGVPRPEAPVPYPDQQQQPPPSYQQPYNPQPAQQEPSPHQLRCMQLEQELANDWVRAQQGRQNMPKIEEEIRKYDRIYQSTRAQAEREDCYESLFIFGRQLRRSPRCVRLHNQIEDARRQLARLHEQRESVNRPGGARYRQDELIDALARAGCGPQYQREARRRDRGWFSGWGWFQEEPPPRSQRETSRVLPFATYRTLCVRTCDGYYFPISYSTLPSRFAQDVAQCQNQCAAPAQLFVYRNPGEEPEQMVSADGRLAYGDLANAWRYRKEYVKGCSCKSEEYNPAEIEATNKKKDDKEAVAATPRAPGDQAPKQQ